jgi:tetratricopeptide (TPR) repeat protein
MSEVISERERWRNVRRQKRLQNGRYWLEQVKKSADLAGLLSSDYVNLLQAIEVAVKDEEAFDIAYQLLDRLSFIVYGQGDGERWITYLKEAVAMAERLGRYSEQGRILELTAGFVRKQGELKQAEESYQAAIGLFKQTEGWAAQARTMAKLASLYDGQDRLVQAIALCQEAQVMVEAVADIQVKGDIHLTLGSIYAHARNHELALAEAQKAYECYLAADIPTWATRALSNIAGAHAQLGNWSEAEAASQKAMGYMIAMGDIRAQANLKNELGIVAFYQGHYQAAEKIWQEALILCTQTQDGKTLATVQNNLGKAYTQLGEWETAEQKLKQALVGSMAMGDDYNQANSLDNLADLYEAKGEWANCRRVLQEGISSLEEAAVTKAHCQKLRNSMIDRLARLPDSP